MAKGLTWPMERIRDGLDRFYKENHRYPTATEFDECPYLPRAKTAERRFGGLVALRKQLNIGSEHDLRTGAHSSKRAHTINERAHILEKNVYELLCKQFGKEFVHREYFYTDDHRTRADFFVYDGKDGFCVDVFYASSLKNIGGCLNLKLAKYSQSDLLPYPIIFLQMNEDINQSELNELVQKKKRGLGQKQTLMSWKTFEEFYKSRKPLRVLRS
ncbi:hypothetical protein A3F27_00365 [Candidatus Kaiserbacteria bacterium RIFCSPHIGHO2_12_FULL_53_13]|uniref:Uncharacterized protein n=1 Tax=Candidatus Kaiserbacteria bacterium RIFCSPHIGHO2_12_FULL_53_13 TaxID=1798502 RepID=A0A1F6E7N7_9BACT|nr:MAG: hypothetical protein A3F27_00365 [Candidatus Kaiserbacteria bacterium RIFCSPHIGHO2_12_FULL_53_13]OGG74414.1 MAG: hypothetical protein A3A37_02070 [Candidatus Kaiserbacteria bacterium RIFCSPLOWO2_01_FULL_52_36]